MGLTLDTLTSNGRTSNREERRSYVSKARRLGLTFEGSDLDGLVVLTRSLSVGTMMDVAMLAGDGSVRFTPAGVKDLGRMFEMFAEALVKWNHERYYCVAHGLAECGECGCADHADLVCEDCDHRTAADLRPTPPTLDGVWSLDISEALAVIKAWFDNAASIPGGTAGPLPEGSTGGAPSPVASIPMDVQSPNPSS